MLQPRLVKRMKHMALIEDDGARFRVHLTALQSLDAAQLDRLTPVGQSVVGLDDSNVSDALLSERFKRLVDEGYLTDNERKPIALALSALDDLSRNLCLARASWGLQDNTINALPNRLAKRRKRFILVIP
jgi:hypothetical protein